MGRISREEYEEARKKYNLTKTYEEMKEANRGYDHPDTMNNFEATVLYIVVMVGGSIFNDRMWIWIAATVLWYKHISRHWR